MQRIVDGLDWFVHIPTRPGPLRKALLWGSAIFLIYGIVSGLDSRIGYSTPGTPLYQPTSKVNRDIAEVGKNFPLEDGWVILTTPSYPDPQSVLGPNVLRMVTDLRSYLFNDPKVGQVVAFSSTVAQPFNEMFHYGYPKYLGVPETLEMSGNLWFLFLNGSAPGELERFISNRSNNDTCIRVLLRDHTYGTLNDVRARDREIRTGAGRARSELKPRRSALFGRYCGLVPGGK